MCPSFLAAGSFKPHSREKGHLVPAFCANARGCTEDSRPMAHAMESVEIQRWERVLGAGWWDCCLFCVTLCPLQLGTPRHRSGLFSPDPIVSPQPWPVLALPCPPQCPEHPSRCCELPVCGNNSAGGGVAPKTCTPFFFGAQVPSVKPNTPPSRPPGHLTPS